MYTVFQAEMGYETKLEDDGSGWITKSQNFLFQLKQTPWYLVSLHSQIPSLFFFCYVLPTPHDLKAYLFLSLNQLFRKTVLVG